jgi:uncharacterized protein (TIGR00251 family)
VSERAPFEPDGEGARLSVRVKPRAAKSRVLGVKSGVLEVAVAAPPVDGAANDELLRTLAAHFDVPRSTLQIASGQTSRLKVVRFRRRPTLGG